MPSFSKKSLEKLNQCHPDLITLMNEVIKTTDITVITGHRGKEAQDKAYREGKSKVLWPNGKHNQTPSLAVDIAPYPVDWNDINRFKILGAFVLDLAKFLKTHGVIAHEIEWGGNWKKFKDWGHFEIK
jgi:peptidoglycan L-alanyl-D-glutamate endopeptidase CwlK